MYINTQYKEKCKMSQTQAQEKHIRQNKTQNKYSTFKQIFLEGDWGEVFKNLI